MPDVRGLPPRGAVTVGGGPAQTAGLVNLANGITVMRILLVPVFAVFLLHDGGDSDGWRVLAWGVFALASITDRIDGDLARRRGLVTDFGKMADPIADKALIGTALIGLSILDLLPWWVTIVILGREVAVTLLRLWVLRHGVLPASRGGKIKTFFQACAIGLYVLPLPGWLHVVAVAFMAAAVTLTLVTGGDYVFRALALRRISKRTTEPTTERAAVRAETRAATVGHPVTAAQCLSILARSGRTLAVAESLTGGMLAAVFTSVPGASRSFRGGVVVYATDLKATLAGVPAEMLATFGPVSEPVAAALAAGVRERLGADIGLATTGVAGPDKQDGIEVGTVYVALADGGAAPVVERLALDGTRARIRGDSMTAAVELLGRHLAP